MYYMTFGNTKKPNIHVWYENYWKKSLLSSRKILKTLWYLNLLKISFTLLLSMCHEYQSMLIIQQYNLLHWYATRYLWDVVVSALTFLLLQFDGDTSHWPSLNTLHQVSDEPVINKHFIITFQYIVDSYYLLM